jgi:hypothetical protein
MLVLINKCHHGFVFSGLLFSLSVIITGFKNERRNSFDFYSLYGLLPDEINLHCIPKWQVFSIHSSVEDLGCCFPGLGFVNNTVLSKVMQVCRLHIDLGSFGCMPGGHIPVSSGVSLFGGKRNLRPASHHDFRGSSWHRVCASVTAWWNPGKHLRLSAMGLETFP